MAGGYGSLFDFGASGATNTGSQGGSSVVKPPSAGIDWKSILGMLGNKPQQGMQLPFQPLQGQYSTGTMTQQLPTPAMFSDTQQQQTSAGDVEQWAKFIKLLFA